MLDEYDPERSMVRRSAGCVRVELGVDAVSEHNFWCDLSMDIRTGGVFIATHEPLRIGTVVEITLRLDAGEPLIVGGVVRWTRPYFEGSDGPAGVGVKFVSLDSAIRELLSRFVQTVREPILFELDEMPLRHRASA